MALEGMDAFREYLVFAKHLNITKAADELHVSPSTLSHHISALERELGMPLIRHEGNSLTLTPVGSLVLKKASTLVGEYQALLDQIARYKEDASYVVRVAYALDDRTMIDAISLAKLRLKSTYGGFNVRPFHVRGHSNREALLNDEIDVFIDYDIGGSAVGGETGAGSGTSGGSGAGDGSVRDARLTVVPLMEDGLLLALPKGTFPGQQKVHVSQVCRRYIPHPSASVDNYIDRVLKLFDGCEHTPPVRLIDASTMDEFFMHALDSDEMWLFSRRQFCDYASSIPLSYRESCEIHELEGCETSYRRCAVFLADNPNRLVPLFVQELAQVDPAAGA